MGSVDVRASMEGRRSRDGESGGVEEDPAG